MIRVGINGAGRIGRAFLKLAMQNPEMEVVAINDLGDIGNITYLLKYDSAYGMSHINFSADAEGKKIMVGDKSISFLSEKDPTLLPWGAMNVDVVVESSGAFTTFEKAKAHITAGAKRVVITAPSKEDPKNESEATILMGINEDRFEKCIVSSNASCTTNAGSPLMQILHEKIGIEKAILSTVHGYTASQSIVDGPNKKDWKEGRAAAHNIVPTSTGAAIAVTKAIPDLKDKFDGISMRVPVIAGSIADITLITKRNTSVEEVNQILKDAAREERWKGIYTVTEDPLVSSDIVGSLFGSIADLGCTKVVDGNLVKVCAWYDNEMGYAATLIKHVLKAGSFVKK